MDTKKAIKFLLSPLVGEYTQVDGIIELLKRGEKYKRILEHVKVITTNAQVKRIVKDTLLGG